jgi:hypothetical protein
MAEALLVFTALPSDAGWDNGPADPPGPVVRSEDVVAPFYQDAADGEQNPPVAPDPGTWG